MGSVSAAEQPTLSDIVLAQVMLPVDANPSGNVHGGTIMKLVDTAGGIVASRHARRRVVTAEVDSMTFDHPVLVGDLVLLRSTVTWTGRTSMEVRVVVDTENPLTGLTRRTSTAFLVYVALDELGRPAPVPPLRVKTDAQRTLWEGAERRRRYRLASRSTSQLP